MKNYKPTVEVSVGNPAKEGEEYLIFYETNKMIAYRVRVKEAYFGYDNDNNFVIKGKGYYSDSSSHIVKADVIQSDSTTNSENTHNKSINADDININAVNDIKIKANKFILDCEDILLNGKTTIGNLTSLEKESSGDKMENIYEYDSVMTVSKFKNFYEKKFIPIFELLREVVNNFNTHTHGVAPNEKQVIDTKSGATKMNKTNLSDLQTSQTTKVI